MNAKKTLATLALTITTAFTLASCSNGPQTSGPKDEVDYEVIFYTPKGDTAAVVISDDRIVGYTSHVMAAEDKRTGYRYFATAGTTVIAKPIPAIK